MLLINPPGARNCEPPPALARLARFLRAGGLPCRILDGGLEGTLFLLKEKGLTDPAFRAGTDTWTRRSVRNIDRNLDILRSNRGYTNRDRYARAVNDLQKALSAGMPEGIRPGLANYEDSRYSSLSREGLIAAARNFENNPFFPYWERSLPDSFSDFPCRTVGISLNFLSQAVNALALAGFLRTRYPDKKIILGGGLVTSWIRQTILPADDTFEGFVDALLPGRGEETLPRWLEENGYPFTAGGEGSSSVFPQNPMAAESLPPFDELPLDSYLSPVRVLPWNFTHGCAWRRCTFCPEKAEDSGFHAGVPAQAAEELALLTGRFSPGLIHLTDNEIPPAFLRALIHRPPGAKWYGFCRFTSVLEDPSFCRQLAESGCVMLQLGLETGDQKVLDSLEKGIRVESALKSLANLKAAGIGTYVYLLFGTPAEDEAAARRTLTMVEENIELMDFLNLAIFNLPVSSDLASTLKTGTFYEGDLSLYSEFAHPAGWNRGEVRRFLSGEFIKCPTVRDTINSTPPVFTSNHAPFFINSLIQLHDTGAPDKEDGRHVLVVIDLPGEEELIQPEEGAAE